MWTTSNFRGRDRWVTQAIAVLGLLTVVSAYGQAPDSPRPAQPTQAATKGEDNSAYRGTIELKAARVRRLDSTLEKMAGPEFLKTAREPLAVEVQTARPLPTRPRDTSAILIINGERFMQTWAILPDRLVTFVDRSRLRATNTVAAAWTGAEETSMTRKPVTFRVGDVIR